MQILLIILLCCICLFKFDNFYGKVIAFNSIVINMLMIHSLFSKDNYLEANGYYKLFNISRINIIISKSILLYIILTLHLSFIILYQLNTRIQFCYILNVMLLIIFIFNIIFYKSKWKLITASILLVFLSLLLLTYYFSLFLIITIPFLIVCIFLLVNKYYYFTMNTS
jgi:hypothetical protein